MPLTKNVDDLIKSTGTNEAEHLVVFVDTETSQMAYCLFMPASTELPDPDGLHQLFDETMAKLSHPETVYYSVAELPILAFVGPYEVAVIERDTAGGITVKDGREQPVENHMGIGG
jgi:hypothetical protein